ncbi:MAG: TonB-dependent receptor [Rhodothermales bacterium]|nr:TonB-dependent receptor [Rhodothermales bacterium]
MKLAGFLIVILLPTLNPVAAQGFRIEGIVTSQSGTPLPGAHVFVEDRQIGAVTKNDGSYSIELGLSGQVTLVCSVVGFERYEVSLTITRDLVHNIQLRERWIRSEEIVVSASRRPRIATSVPSSVSVISAETIQQQTVISLDDALRNVAGVQVQGNQINIRGASGFAYNTGSKVLLMIDGAPVLSPDSDGLPSSVLPSDRIERIEVLKGAGSALYGSSAFGGIINVITRTPNDKEFVVETDLGAYGRFRHDEWRAGWSGSTDLRYFAGISTSIAGSLGGRTRGWLSFSARTDKGYRNLDESRQLQAVGKVVFRRGGSLSGDVLAIVGGRRADSFLFWAGINDPLSPGTIAISQSDEPSGSADNSTNRVILIPTITYQLGQAWYVQSQTRLLASAIRPIDSQGNRKSLSDGTLGFRVGTSVQLNHIRRTRHHFTTGLSIDANSTNSTFFVTSNGDAIGRQPEGSVFGQWDYEISRVSATAGLRFDSYSIDASETVSKLSPRLALGYRLLENTTARVSVGTGFRVPSLAERFTDNQEFFPIFRNLSLRPETSAGIEVGLRSSRKMSFALLEVDAAAFWNRYDNLIEPRFVRSLAGSDSSVFGFQFINLDEGTVRGLDLLTTAHVGSALKMWAGYTLLDSENAATGEALPYRSRHMLKAGGTYVAGERWTVGSDVRMISSPETIDTDFSRFVPDASTFVPIRVVDLRVGHMRRKADFFFTIKNVLDYYHVERPAIIAAPRTFTLRSVFRLNGLND